MTEIWENKIEGLIETLKDQLNTHWEIITSLRSGLESLESKVEDLESEIEEIKGYVY